MPNRMESSLVGRSPQQVDKMLANKPYLSPKNFKNDVKLVLGDKLTNNNQE